MRLSMIQSFLLSMLCGATIAFQSTSLVPRTHTSANSRHRFNQFPRIATLDKNNHCSSVICKAETDKVATSSAYQRFLESEEKREIVANSKVFGPLQEFEQELVILSLELVELESEQKLVTQGDKPDALYFLASGSLSCYNEETPKEEVVRLDEKGTIIGELGILLNEPRALSVQSGEEGTRLWKLSKDKYQKIMASTSKTSIAKSAELDQEYPEYMSTRERKKIMAKCPIFSSLSTDELNSLAVSMEQIVLPKGGLIISQGDQGDEMYFVAEGTVECFDEESGKVLKSCPSGDYFGELAMFLNMPRQLSVRASCDEDSGNVVLWKVKASDFFASLEVSAINDDVLKELRGRYQTKNPMVERSGELLQSLVYRSKPKKKPVSLHSIVAAVTSGVFLSVIFSNLSFGKQPNGMLEILSTFRQINADQANTIFFSLLMFAVTAVMGIFRLPPNTPALRRSSFLLLAIANLQTFLIGCSSLNMSDFYWFDAFTRLGKLVLASGGALFVYMYLAFFHAGLTTDEESAESLPMLGSLQMRLFTNVLVWSGAAIFTFMLAPLASTTLGEYTAKVVAPMRQLKATTFLIMVAFTTSATNGFSALIATLQFEKKIKPAVGTLFILALAFLLNYDASIGTAQVLAGGVSQESMNALNGVFIEGFRRTRMVKILGISTIATFVHGLYTKIKSSRVQKVTP